MVRIKENPAKIASWLHKQHPRFRPLALSLSRLIPSMMMSAAFITSFFDFEISNYIGLVGSFLMILISIVSACLKVKKTNDENIALLKTFKFVKKNIDQKTKMGISFSNKDISDLLGTFCEMTIEREIPVEVPLETSVMPCTCGGMGCSACEGVNTVKTCFPKVHFSIVMRILKGLRTVVNDFVPGWLFMTYVKDIQRIYTLEIFSKSSGPTRLESWYSFTDFEKAIEIIEACGIFLALVTNLVNTFVHCCQLCHCSICKVRNIEDRIKRIGRNPICREETAVKGGVRSGHEDVNKSKGEDVNKSKSEAANASSIDKIAEETDKKEEEEEKETETIGKANKSSIEDVDIRMGKDDDIYHVKLKPEQEISKEHAVTQDGQITDEKTSSCADIRDENAETNWKHVDDIELDHVEELGNSIEMDAIG